MTFLKEHEMNAFQKGVALKSGVKALLKYLKDNHYQIVLATSSTYQRAILPLKQHHIDHYFDAMVFASDVKRGKPYPDIFLKACEKTKTAVHEALVLEDSEAGIQASFLAGIPVICIPDMKKPSTQFEKMTEAIFLSLDDVMGYLQQEEVKDEEKI